MHEVVSRAAEGQLPAWAEAEPDRRSHMARVADLMEEWALALGLGADEQRRWRAAGMLHDALRDADPGEFRPRVPPALRGLPDAILHGPVAAERLRVEGVEDGELLRAVTYHTVGHPDFRTLGRALYAADFLEPGRSFSAEWRAGLRDRMPAELDAVVSEIVRARLGHLLDRGMPLDARTVGFWNRLAVEAK